MTKRTILIIVGLVFAMGALSGLKDLTQNQKDPVVEGSTTTIDYSVDTNRFSRGKEAAATALWTACIGTVGGDVSPIPEAVDGHWRVTVTPSIGEHGENRLVGCLEDVTLDRIVGNVLSLQSDR